MLLFFVCENWIILVVLRYFTIQRWTPLSFSANRAKGFSSNSQEGKIVNHCGIILFPMLVPHHHFYNKNYIRNANIVWDGLWNHLAFICQNQLFQVRASVKPQLSPSSLIGRPPVCPHEVIPSLMWSCLGLPLVSRSSSAHFDHSFALRWWKSVYAVLSAIILFTASLLSLPTASSLSLRRVYSSSDR